MKLSSNKFIIIIYHISVGIVEVQYLVLMGVIYVRLKTLSSGRGIAATVLIIQVLHMTNRAYTCCINLGDSESDLLMVGSESTII